MNKFEKNIIDTFGREGEAWLVKLTDTLKILQAHWRLNHLEQMPNMTYHYVAKTYDENNVPVILKVGCNSSLIEREAKLLEHFADYGSIRVLDHHHQFHALLLQQAIPGITLKSLHPARTEFVMDRYIETMNHLHEAPLPENQYFENIIDWLQTIDTATSNEIPENLLRNSLILKEEMLLSMKTPILLHGDLHLDNILQHGDKWLVIDPKGVFGEPEFEIAGFDFISNEELDTANSDLFLKRIQQIANKANLSYTRILNWTFIRLILSAAWSLEDNSDPTIALKLSQLLEHETTNK